MAFDSETSLIRPANLAPRLACLTWQKPGSDAQIADTTDARRLAESWFVRQDLTLTGANVAYDLAVLCAAFPDLPFVQLVFRALDDDRVTDVQIRQKLLDIAAGVYRGRFVGKGKRIPYNYDLESIAKRCAGLELQKDAWRLSYAEFIGIPLAAWPARAVQVQRTARESVTKLRSDWSHVKASDVPKEVTKTIEGLDSMIASDPNRCTEYPLDDARATLAVHVAQERHVAYLEDQFRQTRAAFWLHLSSAWGLHTDAAGVERLRLEIQEQVQELETELVGLGLIRETGVANTKLAKALMVDVCLEAGITIPRTDGHEGENAKCKDKDGNPLPPGHDDCAEHVSLDAESCEASEDPTLESYAEVKQLKKILSNDLVNLANGAIYPLHTRYNIAETGRTTSSKPPIQNLSKMGGIRECFIPREGNVFWQVDYPTLELYTLAQCCMSWLGESQLAATLNGGKDPHLWVASIILQTTYEDALAHKAEPEVKKARQLAKPANFGFPGGMGIKKFVASTRKAVLKEKDGRATWAAMGLDEARAKRLKEEWLLAFPEMGRYFKRVNDLCDNDSGRALVETLWTKRFRGNATYCAACNNGFQGLGCDCAKEAGWRICRAQYAEPESVLFGTRTVAFVHDELIGECKDDDRAHDVAYEVARHMVEGANVYLPDVPIPLSKMEPTLMRRWSKNAVQVFGPTGRLVPWT
jgi:hypothetical protein